MGSAKQSEVENRSHPSVPEAISRTRSHRTIHLPELELRLALCSHIRVPNESEIDHLAEVEKVFAPKQEKKTTTKKRPSGSRRLPKAKQSGKKARKRIAA